MVVGSLGDTFSLLVHGTSIGKRKNNTPNTSIHLSTESTLSALSVMTVFNVRPLTRKTKYPPGWPC